MPFNIPVPIFAAIISWVLAQLIKTVHHVFKYKTFDKERLAGAGGMPSAHSAGVAALCVSVGQIDGYQSTTFSIAVIFAFTTFYDAMSVRWNSGLHARELNRLRKGDEREVEEHIPAINLGKRGKFKEHLGHTPAEVVVGILFGIAMGYVLSM
jgi:acid phosphatase family membrane protein YuiD